MEKLLKKAISIKNHLNEQYIEVTRDDFRETCRYLWNEKNAILRLMFATDERSISGSFKVHTVFSIPGMDRFFIMVLSLQEDDPSFPCLTVDIPAAHWYEREIRDLFGLVPQGHPDLRRLLFHESFPANSYPLRKDWTLSESDAREWGEGTAEKEPYRFMEVEGEGIYEIPVGPVHAGIIEPGHFRFSALGETIFFLEPRLFYTHKGTEKLFESRGFKEGVNPVTPSSGGEVSPDDPLLNMPCTPGPKTVASWCNGVNLAERVSGTSSFSHSSAYCMAVERMMGIQLTDKAAAARTLLLEMERLYNHIGDIGNLCAGTGLAVGYARGAEIKERLMQLNQRVTGSRYLRGVNLIGGISKEIFPHSDDIRSTLDTVTKEYKGLMELLLGTVSHIERLENTGVLSREIARKLGATGITARASGIPDDIRHAHPHLFYDRLDFEANTLAASDVFARMMVRAADLECSISIMRSLIEGSYQGHNAVETRAIEPLSSSLGYTEGPRGSIFYWVMADQAGGVFRVKLRSASFCNWPAVPFAVHGNIVPDFPLCNKSFNLSYSGCDM